MISAVASPDSLLIYQIRQIQKEGPQGLTTLRSHNNIYLIWFDRIRGDNY